MPRPAVFGWFHLLCLALSIAVGVWLVRRFPAPTERQVRRVLSVTAVICLLLEVYKQVVYSFTFDGERVIFGYPWYIFPFQFCSTPMYAGLLAGLTHGRMHERFAAYLGSYAVFAGGAVMVCPSEVFTNMIGVNLQTMVCHGSMISIGIFLLCGGYVKTDISTFKKAFSVFVIAFLMAVVMNEAAYHMGILNHGEFNMFYISPYGTPLIPVLSVIQAVFPAPVPQMIYFVLFSVLAYAVLLLFRGINRAIMRVAQRKKVCKE